MESTERGVILKGLTKLTDFIEFLRNHHVGFDLKNVRPGAIMVVVSLPYERYEVEFFEDRAEWAVFTGNEDCEDDFVALYSRIAEHAR